MYLQIIVEMTIYSTYNFSGYLICYFVLYILKYMLDYFIEEVLFVTKYITNEPMDDGVLYAS